MKSLFLVLVLSLSSNAFSGDAAAGKKVWNKVKCQSCHKPNAMGMAKPGKDGKPAIRSIMTGPQLAGLSEKYMVAQLKAIHDGTRKTKNTKEMKKRIKKLKAVDFENVAAYIAQKKNPKKLSIKGMNE